ncbi:RelA/SpoT family protein [Candidatus Phytoplasma pini]|uniref:Penta-phosphate guanosine-3'-pyrophosphohydrolase n=1 Tax=Candidatus Phytoplasma pini TaxID=267362 RepID=A0A559KJC1_9MOLU|nr:RelA/SpoT family protein [Candidatus Phytoplasma pini]TVY12231.1 GTP pyrophosphokinase [Candidatus Phytoplasma pini]
MFFINKKGLNINIQNENILYKEFIQKVKEYIFQKDVLDKIHQVYLFSKEKHSKQKRETGEDFIVHPLSVAKTLADFHSEPNTLMAGLLHDILEDTDLIFEELRKFVGDDVSYIVKKVTKLSELVFDQEQRQIENQQKMFLAMAKDIRVVLIKIADRLHNMQTLYIMRSDKQIRISKETLSIYAPLTHRLCLFQIKSQLEDLSFRYINPNAYYHISHLISIKKQERDKTINKIIQNITLLLRQSHIENFLISGRSKNIYSIYKKMQKRHVNFEEIFDLLAVRIVVKNVDLCYRCLGIIHANYSPLPSRFKDYIAVPKSNLYKSLHNTVLSKYGLFEVQIRTKEMNEMAERGIAAHWSYKENTEYSRQKKQLEIVQKLRWYRDLIQITKDSKNHFPQNSKDFVDTIKNDILSENVYVFTPKHEVFELTKGSTIIDFAFRIHSSIGLRTIGAIVNGKITPLSYELKNGDIITIKTSKNISKINREWLRIAKTNSVKKNIKKILNKREQDQKLYFITKGKEILEKELLKHKIEYKIDQCCILKHFSKRETFSSNDFYFNIGNKKISVAKVVEFISSQNLSKENSLEEKISKNYNKENIKNKTVILIEGLDNVKIKFANCCNPIFNEEIIGFISKEKSVNIHLKDCFNLKKCDQNKILSVSWADHSKTKYISWLVIVGSYSSILLTQINNKLNILGIDILKLNIINNNKLSETIIRLQILVKDIQEMNQLISSLSQLSNIYQIYRKTR